MNKFDLIKTEIVKSKSGIDVYLREWNCKERRENLAALSKQKEDGNLELDDFDLLIRGICDEKGNLIFVPEDKEQLEKLPYSKFRKLVDEVLEINGFSNLEPTKKNSKKVISKD